MISARRFGVFLILILTIESVLVPVRESFSRCMIEFMVAQANTGTVKIKIVFPEIQRMERGQHFTVSVRNTQTNQVENTAVGSGKTYFKQMDMADNVIYDICMQIRTERSYEAIVDYTSEKLFFYNHQQIKVPESLLKKTDLKETYELAATMGNTVADYSAHQGMRKHQDKGDFFQTQKLHNTLSLLSSFECIVVVAVGVYQFFTLKNYLENRRFI